MSHIKSQNRTNKHSLNQPLFANHLEKLELLSLATRRITEILPRNASAEKAICLLWDILSDFIATQGSADLEDLGKLSSIIQRTASAAKQIQSLEDDSVDFVRKAVDFDTTRRALLDTLSASVGKPGGISQQTLERIEQELSLL